VDLKIPVPLRASSVTNYYAGGVNIQAGRYVRIDCD
jgi:hypothetical protein